MATSTSENIRETNSISTTTDIRETNTISTLTETPETNTVETITETCGPQNNPSRSKKYSKNSTTFEKPTLPDILDKIEFSPILSAMPSYPVNSPDRVFLTIPNSSIQTKQIYRTEIDTVGHQRDQSQSINTGKHGPNNSPSSPYPINNMLIDNEFINSEFYIDESLPSSLNDDEINFKDHTARAYHNVHKEELLQFSGHPQSSSDESIAADHNLDKSIFNNQSLETVFCLLQVLDTKTIFIKQPLFCVVFCCHA